MLQLSVPPDASVISEPTLFGLTLWQPWCYAFAHLGKRVENRQWQPYRHVLGKRIALHAGATLDKGSFEAIRHLLPEGLEHAALPRKAVCATARLVRVVSAADELPEDQRQWFMGPFGWVFDGLLVLPQPVPSRGAQGIWRLPLDVHRAVQIQELAARRRG